MARVYQAFYRLPISINLLQFWCGYTSQKLLVRQLSALLC